MFNKFISRFCLAIILAMSSILQVAASEHVIVVKGGTYNFGDTRQVIDIFPSTVTATFEDDGNLFGVEYDHVFDNNVSIGGGFETYSLDYTSSAGNGTVDVANVTFNSKIFLADGDFKPFIGGSVGFALTDFTGGVVGNSIGLAAAFMAGFRYQFSTVGLYVEYKNYVLANTEDALEAEVDVAGDGVFAGISISF